MIGFGLDPAGYVEGRSVLAVARRQGREAQVCILSGCPFSKMPNEDREIGSILANERTELKKIIELGCCIAIDVPIDLQALPKVDSPTHLWQLTMRSVDKAVGGLQPLASFIGHVTARFQSILCDSQLEREIGRRIFETYPKPTLRKLAGKSWASVEKYKSNKSHRDLLCEILRITPSAAIRSDDDLDAVVCSLTAMATDDEIWPVSDYRVNKHPLTFDELPRGYRLLVRNSFDRIVISSQPYVDWMRTAAPELA